MKAFATICAEQDSKAKSILLSTRADMVDGKQEDGLKLNAYMPLPFKFGNTSDDL